MDAGANIGTYTLLAASLVCRTGSVIAFEPARVAFSRLAENVTLNGLANVKVIQAAVGDMRTKLPMRVSADVSGGLINLRDDEPNQKVAVVRIDDTCGSDSPAMVRWTSRRRAPGPTGHGADPKRDQPPVVLLGRFLISCIRRYVPE